MPGRKSHDPIDRAELAAFPADKRAFLTQQRDSGRVCFIHINKCGGSSVEAALGIPKIHDTAQQRIAKIGRPAWDRMWCFGTIRHPYARVCSLYEFRRKRNMSRIASDGIGLEEWIDRALGAKDPRFYNIPLMFAPCFEWLSDRSGALLVDAAFDVAEIGRHWPDIRNRAGIETSLGWQNATGRFRLKDATVRLSPASRRIVEAHFAPDFEQFNYSPA